MRSVLFWVIAQHTQCGPKVLRHYFKTRTHMTKTCIFFFLIQNMLYWHIHRLLCDCTISEKLLKIQLLGSQQHLQSGVLLTLFLTWGTENSLTEINLESMGGDKGL